MVWVFCRKCEKDTERSYTGEPVRYGQQEVDIVTDCPSCFDAQRVRNIVVSIMKEADWNEFKMKTKLKELGLEDV